MTPTEFTQLRSFALVVEHGSFSGAARALGQSPSATSQAVRRLEERIGVRLLSRTTRSLAPTSAGARLIVELAPLLASFERVLDEARSEGREPLGRLRLSVPRTAITTLVAPMLSSFCAAHPAVELEVSVTDRLVSLVAERFDAGIRLGERIEADMIAVRLTEPLRSAVVASPGYLSGIAPPSDPHDLRRHRCARYRWPSSGLIYDWEFEVKGHPVEVEIDGPLITDDIGLMLCAAADGLGLAHVLERDAEPFLTDGRLVRLLGDFCPSIPGLYLYHASPRHMAPALRAFIDFLVERTRSSNLRGV